MRIIDGGNVGIGTSTPDERLSLGQGDTISLQGAASSSHSGTRQDLMARMSHMLDGGFPTNPYPTSRDTDDAEFSNSTQALNNTIGTHAGGDFWEWKDDASFNPPTATYEGSDINTEKDSCLYVRKSDSNALPSALVGDIKSLSSTSVYKFEVFVLPTQWNKTDSYFAVRLVDSSTGTYARVILDDDGTNGLTLVAAHDSGGGETVGKSLVFGNPIGPIVLGMRSYEASGIAYYRVYYQLGGAGSDEHCSYRTRFYMVGLTSSTNWVPDEVWLEFGRDDYLEYYIDSYRVQ